MITKMNARIVAMSDKTFSLVLMTFGLLSVTVGLSLVVAQQYAETAAVFVTFGVAATALGHGHLRQFAQDGAA